MLKQSERFIAAKGNNEQRSESSFANKADHSLTSSHDWPQKGKLTNSHRDLCQEDRKNEQVKASSVKPRLEPAHPKDSRSAKKWTMRDLNTRPSA
jgi:hypothetical protein